MAKFEAYQKKVMEYRAKLEKERAEERQRKSTMASSEIVQRERGSKVKVTADMPEKSKADEAKSASKSDEESDIQRRSWRKRFADMASLP